MRWFSYKMRYGPLVAMFGLFASYRRCSCLGLGNVQDFLTFWGLFGQPALCSRMTFNILIKVTHYFNEVLVDNSATVTVDDPRTESEYVTIKGFFIVTM